MDEFLKFKLLKQIPEAEELINSASLKYYITSYSRERVTSKVYEALDELRLDIESGNITYINQDEIISRIINKIIAGFQPSLAPVVNATGIVVNQYLGRSPLSKESISHITSTSIGYCNLDFDLDRGDYTSRFMHLNNLISLLSGAESAIVVNNNTAALMLVVNTFANNKEVIISRGEIIEIEGEFSLPDVISTANAKLIEVGSTNKSYLKDYTSVINDKTAMILKIHTSSYYIKGKTDSVELFALVDLVKSKNILCVEDHGTGLLIDLKQFGLPYEPTIQQSVKTDVDIITFSCDKLLGGPQAGVIIGKKHLIDKILKNPLLRAFRPGKLVISALESTLQFYLNKTTVIENIPVLKMLTKPIKEIELDAHFLYKELMGFHNIDCFIKKGFQDVGGSILPDVKLPTYLVYLKHKNLNVASLHQNFLSNSIVTLIKDDYVVIDPRCLLKRDFKLLSMIFEKVLS